MFFASNEVNSKFIFALLEKVLPITLSIVDPISSVLNFYLFFYG